MIECQASDITITIIDGTYCHYRINTYAQPWCAPWALMQDAPAVGIHYIAVPANVAVGAALVAFLDRNPVVGPAPDQDGVRAYALGPR